MLKKVFSFELSSGALSDTYASGLEIVVASAVELVGVVDGGGDGLVLWVEESREEGVVMIAG